MPNSQYSCDHGSAVLQKCHNYCHTNDQVTPLLYDLESRNKMSAGDGGGYYEPYLVQPLRERLGVDVLVPG